jgi:hypothetical protein
VVVPAGAVAEAGPNHDMTRLDANLRA